MLESTQSRPARKGMGAIFKIAALALSVGLASGGNGSFRNGVYNFCIAVLFNATPAELANIRSAFTEGNKIWADALDGQQRFGTITIVNDCTVANKCGSLEIAEFWIQPGQGRANATYGEYGIRNQHTTLYYRGISGGGANDSDFEAPSGLVGFTIAHEMGHHSFGAMDEYSGSGGAAECAAAAAESATLNYSLMDNYKSRGGRATGGATTLKEFCVRSNHDPDADNYQTSHKHQSVWETIAAHPKRSATAPSGLPSTTAPAVTAPVFRTGGSGLRSVLVLDESGSMLDESRLVLAKQAANVYVDQLKAGDEIAVVAFENTASVRYSLTRIASQADKTAAKNAINALVAGGGTNIGGGLSAALNQLKTIGTRTCNEVIVLLTDGDHNTGTDPASVIPLLQDEAITVLTVGVGAGISTTGQALLQQIASETGGKYYGVSSAANLAGNFFEITTDAQGNNLIVREPLALAAGTPVNSTVTVEPGSASVTFGVSFVTAAANMTITLQTPAGTLLANDTQIVAAGGSVNRGQANIVLFTFPNPTAGNWIVATTSAVSTTAEVFASSLNKGVAVVATPSKGLVQAFEAIVLNATVQYGGLLVTGGSVTGTVVQPDGSRQNITLLDDGSAASGDAVPNDGIFAAKFSSYRANGTYTFTAKSATSSGRIAPGEQIDGPAPLGAQLPAFVRYSSSGFVVTGYDGCSQATPEILFNTPVAGALTTNSCTSGLAAGHFRSRYFFFGTAGQSVIVNLTSPAFDTYLYMLTPDGTVLEDDDGGTSTNSRIPASSGLYTLPITGIYVVEATSYSSGLTGAFTVTVDTVPAITTPTPNQVIATGGVSFVWTAVAGASSYDIRVDRAAGGTVFSGSVAGSSNTTALVALTAGTYTFFVRSCAGGSCGPYSSVTFTAVPPTPTTAPSITAPVQGSTLTTSTNTLVWTAVTGVQSYEVELVDTGVTPNITELKIRVPAPSVSTTFSMKSSTAYQLRVRACQEGCGPYSAIRTFAVNLPPVPTGVPVITSGVVTNGNSLAVVWTGVANADLYQVQVVQPAPAGPGGGALTVAARQTDQLTSTLPVPSGAASIFVKACNGNGCGPNSAPFAINPAGPNPPTANLGTPISGAVVAGPSVFFSWNRIAGDNGTNTVYRLFVQDLSTQSAALDVLTRENYFAAVFNGSGSRYDAIVIANPGPAQTTGPAAGFNVRGLPPQSPTMRAPTHQSTISQGNVTLGWTRLEGATLFEYFVAVQGLPNPSVTGVTPGTTVLAPLNALTPNGTPYSAIVRACPAGASCSAGSSTGWGPWSNVGGSGVVNFTVLP